ncbi:MAG: hypothetical protein NTX72_02825 [Candidatus Uhrbacteria bacterium]|nr:hypothetical protein [Candidatus Uhrbacteria bacterium]
MQTRRLDGELLTAALTARKWTDKDLVRELKAKGYELDGAHIVQKWRKGKNQPSSERIDLIEATLGYTISTWSTPRRSHDDPIPASQIAFA